MSFDISTFKKDAEEKTAWLMRELQGVRTGRATPTLLDSVRVEMYGTLMPLNQAGNLSVQDARTIYITPYDISQIKIIEKAIAVANLGVGIGSDEKGVRVSFPELTTERRGELQKLTRAKMEEARVQLKGIRTKSLGDIKKSDASEDEQKRLEAEVQKIVDATNAKFEEIVKKKEQELSQ